MDALHRSPLDGSPPDAPSSEDSGRRWRHLPNAITASRGLMGPVIAYLVLATDTGLLPFWLFIAAISTDLVDGWVARKLGATSRLGLFLDPMADKTLNGCTWLCTAFAGWCPWWLAGLMLFRTFVVTMFWVFGRQGSAPRPTLPGRLMVTFEGIALPVLLFRVSWFDVHWNSVGIVIGGISLAFAVMSAIALILQVRSAPSRRATPSPR